LTKLFKEAKNYFGNQVDFYFNMGKSIKNH